MNQNRPDCPPGPPSPPPHPLTCALVLAEQVRSERGRNVLLLAAGLVFYAFGSLTGLLLLLACAAVNYGFGLALLRCRSGGRGIAAVAVALDLAFLAAFKYLHFALSVLGSAT